MEGSVGLGGWLHTEVNVWHRKVNPDTVIHLSNNRVRHRLTSLIETNVLLCQTASPPPSECTELKHLTEHVIGEKETRLRRRLTALVLTNKLTTTKKHIQKLSKHNTNKWVRTQDLNLNQHVPSSPVRTAHMSVQSKAYIRSVH